MKYFLSTIVGLLTGIVCISLFEYLAMYIFPLPAGIDMQNIDSIAQNMENIPLINHIAVIVCYCLASFIAGFVSVKFKPPQPHTPVIIIGILLTVAGFINFLTIPHPLWMIIAGSVIFIPSAWYGGKAGLSNRRNYSVSGF